MKVVKNDKKNNKISTTIGILLLVAFSLIFIIGRFIFCFIRLYIVIIILIVICLRRSNFCPRLC